ncbi:hypothetical protein JQM84_13070 [Parabacteroides distasonis]|nr:hypothetical protein [Parabacteroides distasonis]
MSNLGKNEKKGGSANTMWRARLLLVLFCVLTFSAYAWDFAEHRKIGDRAMILMPERLVAAGLFPNEAAFYALLDTVLDVQLSEDGLSFVLNELSQAPNQVTYGTLCGLAGDHVSNPLLLETGLQAHYSKTNRTLLLEADAMQHFQTGANSVELLKVNLAYGVMAIKDLSHFYSYGDDLNDHLRKIDADLIRALASPANVNDTFTKLDRLPSMSKYFCIHIFATYLAEEAGKAHLAGDAHAASDYLFYAMLYEAFAEHFLQDSFASGHQMVRRGFGASAVSNNKALHDFYNTIPVQTANLKGEIWASYGDKRLNQNMEEYIGKESYTEIRVTDPNPYKLPKGDKYERETRVFYQVVNATCQSILEVWQAYRDAVQGEAKQILSQLPERHEEWPAYIYAHHPVVRDFPLPFGTKLTEVPLDSAAWDRQEELQLIVQEPFTRNFIRSRVANSFSFTVTDGLTSTTGMGAGIGGRLSLSMFNWHRFGRANAMSARKGDVIHWLYPTISGNYFWGDMKQGRPDSWDVKAGAAYNLDLFVSPRRFLGLYAYMEMGVDRRCQETRFVAAPAIGMQLGSLLGLHTFNMPGWLRIPLSYLLPLKFTVSCNKVKGRPVEWLSAYEIDILF